MKKLALVLSLVLYTGLTHSQIEVKQSTSETIWRSENSSLSKFNIEDREFYSFYYRNLDYKTIVDLKHIKLDNEAEVLQFLDLVMDVIENEKEEVNLTINGKMYLFSYSRRACLVITRGSHTVITKREIEGMREVMNK